jgi:hypothetical protein
MLLKATPSRMTEVTGLRRRIECIIYTSRLSDQEAFITTFSI